MKRSRNRKVSAISGKRNASTERLLELARALRSQGCSITGPLVVLALGCKLDAANQALYRAWRAGRLAKLADRKPYGQGHYVYVDHEVLGERDWVERILRSGCTITQDQLARVLLFLFEAVR